MKGIVVRQVTNAFNECVVSIYYFPIDAKVLRRDNKVFIEHNNKSYMFFDEHVESISIVSLIEKEKLALYLSEKIRNFYEEPKDVKLIDYDLMFCDSYNNTRCVTYDYAWDIHITNCSNNKTYRYDFGADFRNWIKLHEV